MRATMLGRPVELLLIEDNPADVFLASQYVAGLSRPTRLSVAGDGREAMRRLRREAPFELEPLPDLILLDLNVPLRSGREVLTDLKSDPLLRSIPVLVLSTSGADRDVETCYALHANAYLVKPAAAEEYQQLFDAIDAFWLQCNLFSKA